MIGSISGEQFEKLFKVLIERFDETFKITEKFERIEKKLDEIIEKLK